MSDDSGAAFVGCSSDNADGAARMRLDGVGVLVPAVSALAARCAVLLRERGARVFQAPAITTAAPVPEDAARLGAALEQLTAGAYDWLVVTSARAMAALADAVVTPLGSARLVPRRTRIAAVGQATAAALEACGLRCDFVPDQQSGRGLVAELPAQLGQRILLPQSEIAHDTIAAGLRARGCQVTAVTAYRTVAAKLPEPILAAVREGVVRVAIVTSGSVGRSLARQLGSALSRMRLVSIGAQTTAELRRAGLMVAAEAVQPNAESLVDAVAKTRSDHGKKKLV